VRGDVIREADLMQTPTLPAVHAAGGDQAVDVGPGPRAGAFPVHDLGEKKGVTYVPRTDEYTLAFQFRQAKS
jgi:hypothetical protein